jgi:AcrR family transcriptional regulator
VGTPTSRLPPDERKALLVGAATETFATRGYTQAGLAEVASLAGVSKTLLYHYFPAGRPELYRHVMDRLVDQVVEVARTAARTPRAADQRLDRLVRELLGYFADNPHAYRLLLLEPWGSGDPGVVGHGMAVRARLAGELNEILAPTAQDLPTTLAAGTAALGALLYVGELVMAGQLTVEDAGDVAGRFVTGGLAALGMLGRP